MKVFEKKYEENIIGKWVHYYIFGKRVYTNLVCIYLYR